MTLCSIVDYPSPEDVSPQSLFEHPCTVHIYSQLRTYPVSHLQLPHGVTAVRFIMPKHDEPKVTIDVMSLLPTLLLVLLVYVVLMYTCWGTLSLSKVRGDFVLETTRASI